MTWIGNTISAGEVYLALVDASGTPTGTAAALTSTTGTATAAALAVRAGGWLVGWSDRREADLEVHLRPFDATGAPAGADIKVSNDITDSASPSVAAGNAGFAAAWSDQPTTSTGAPWFAGVCP